MTAATTPLRAFRVVQLVLFNCIVALFVAYLLVEKPSRWPACIVIVLVLIPADMVVIRGARRVGSSKLILPFIYSAGFLYGVMSIIHRFEWWKVWSIPIPLVLVIHSLVGARRRRQQ